MGPKSPLDDEQPETDSWGDGPVGILIDGQHRLMAKSDDEEWDEDSEDDFEDDLDEDEDWDEDDFDEDDDDDDSEEPVDGEWDDHI